LAQPSEKLFREFPCTQDADLSSARSKLLFAFPFAPSVRSQLQRRDDDSIEIARAEAGIHDEGDVSGLELDVPDFMDDLMVDNDDGVSRMDDVDDAYGVDRSRISVLSAAPELSLDEIQYGETETFDALLPPSGGRKQAAKLFFNLLLMQMKGDVVMQQDTAFSQIHIHRSA
jgi:hypothetical protein